MNSLLFWIGLPVIFVLLEVLFNILAAGRFRQGIRKYRVWFRKGDERFIKGVFTINEIHEILNQRGITQPNEDVSDNAERVEDIQEISVDFWEISAGIDMCVGAISAILVAILELIQRPNAPSSLFAGAVIALFVNFCVALLIVFLLQLDLPDKTTRRFIRFGVTNMLGFTTILLSFFLLGVYIQT